MNKYRNHILTLLFALTLLLLPIQAEAAFRPQAVPAQGIVTTLSDTRYINPDFLNRQVALSWQDQTWYMGLIVLKDTPVQLTNVNGQITCTLLDTSILKAYLGHVDVNLKALGTPVSNEVIFANQNGTRVTRSGLTYQKLNEHVETWLATYLGQIAVSPSCINIEQTLNEHFLITVSDQPSYSLSDDYIIAGTCTTSFKTSGANRVNNVTVAASRTNNMLVMPGQVVSMSTTFLPRNAANG